MISVNECETALTASGQFEIEKKYGLVLISSSEIQAADAKATTTTSDNMSVNEIRETNSAGVQDLLSSATENDNSAPVTDVGSNFVNIFSADEQESSRPPEKTPIMMDSVHHLASHSKVVEKRALLKRLLATSFDAIRFLLLNHVSIIVYLILSAFLVEAYFMPELVNETLLSEAFDVKMKVAIVFVLFILIQDVYFTLNEKYSKSFRILAVPFTWLFIACTYYIVMTLIKAYTSNAALNMQLMNLALKSKQHEQELQIELQRQQKLSDPSKLQDEQTGTGEANDGFGLPSFFSLFL